jgi:hypothetical protein
MRICWPAVSEEVVRAATPFMPIEAVPTSVVPSSKSTDPEGAVPFPVTRAESVRLAPAAEGVPEVESTVVVLLVCTV